MAIRRDAVLGTFAGARSMDQGFLVPEFGPAIHTLEDLGITLNFEAVALFPIRIARARCRLSAQGDALDKRAYFDYSGNMDTTRATEALAALAHETRLNVFRMLVEAGPEGLAAGRIGEELQLPGATLSFHLAHLTRAGLVQSRQAGRFVIYSADFQNMNALVGYLTENCCGGRSCAPSVKSTVKGASHEAIPRARRRA